jgi:hypothetical protein
VQRANIKKMQMIEKMELKYCNISDFVIWGNLDFYTK